MTDETDPTPTTWPEARHALYVGIRRALLDEFGGSVMRADRATRRALDVFEELHGLSAGIKAHGRD